MTSTNNCVFCAIVAGTEPATIVREWPDAIAFLPRAGVGQPGDHVLIVPRCHVADAIEDDTVTGMVSARGSQLARERGWTNANLIFNIGPYGSQTILHLHGHLMRRWLGDRIVLPWPQPLQEPA